MRPTGQRIGVLLLAILVGSGAGIASGVFLESLTFVSNVRLDHPWLLFLLPAAGALIAWLYAVHGRAVAGGTNLILDEIHSTSGVGVPVRMLPLILGTTLLTHLFGGSAGREGTAVQMGGSLASGLARRFRLSPETSRLILICGIAGGFSGVFGTPVAATIFAIEVLAIGRLLSGPLLPCLVSAVAADQTVRVLSIEHAHYRIASPIPDVDLRSILIFGIAGISFGLASALFVELTAAIEHASRSLSRNAVVRTAIGGGIIVGVSLALGTRDYNGLSLPLIERSLAGEHVPALAFLIKLGMTALTLGVGFKGGEVTPLFVIGATMGASLAGPLDMPVDLLAAAGFVSVFAAAANTPIACIAMSVELFGGDGILLFSVAIVVAYFASGHRGIYGSQRLAHSKNGARLADGIVTLRDVGRHSRGTRDRPRW